MNINTAYLNTLLSASASNGSGSQATQATGTLAAASAALTKTATRIQADASATTAQLSSFGQLKSALAGSQTAALALTQLSSASSASEVTQATGDFFNAFNAAVKAAKTTAAVSGSSQAAQAAGRVGRDLAGALTGGVANQNAMSKLGLSVQADGSLKQDASKFAAALAKDPAGVMTALAQLGQQVQSAANKELASDGNVGASVAKLTQHSSALAQQQKAMLSLQQSTGLSVYQRASAQ